MSTQTSERVSGDDARVADPTVAVVVPTLGRSPVLLDCLRALANQDPRPEIVLVVQGQIELDEQVRSIPDHVLENPENLGFAAATNQGIDITDTVWVAAVNDDVVLEDGWLKNILRAFEEHPQAAAVQGMNLQADDPQRIDGCGISWNRWWQATQTLRGALADSAGIATFETAGASATATVYRSVALGEARLPHGDIFDSHLESYYEDVDLALRLAALGYTAHCSPIARATHLGSVTGKTLGRRRLSLIYGNRLLTLRRAAGTGFASLLPKLALRDAIDAIKRPTHLPGIASGWLRAAGKLGQFSAPAGSLSKLRAASRMNLPLPAQTEHRR